MLVRALRNEHSPPNLRQMSNILRHSGARCSRIILRRPLHRAALLSTSPYESSPSAPSSSFQVPISDYLKLSKSRLSGLVALSTTLGFLSAGTVVSIPVGFCTILGTALASASANTFNQIIEIESDKLMHRTRNRPLPTGRLSVAHATGFGIATGISSAAVLYFGTNSLTAVIGVSNILMYTLMYTPMKKISTWNTAFGAIVGALPPVMGWTAATNNLFAPEVAVLFLFQFLWQVPHFLSLAYKLRKDYTLGGYRMLSVDSVDPSGKSCAHFSLLGAIAMVPIPFVTSYVDMTNWMFAIDGTVINLWFLFESYRFYQNITDANAMRLFKSSLVSLWVLLALFVFHKQQIGNNQENEAKHSWILDLCVDQARKMGALFCAHEVIANKEVNESNLGDLCVNPNRVMEHTDLKLIISNSQHLLSSEKAKDQVL